MAPQRKQHLQCIISVFNGKTSLYIVYQLQLVNDVIVTTLSVGTSTLMAFSAVEDK